MTRLRVLFAIPRLDQGGPDRVFFELLRGLPRDSFAPELAVGRGGGRYIAELPTDVPVHVVGEGYPVAALTRVVRAVQPDVVLTTLRMNLTAALGRIGWPRRVRHVARQANQLSTDFAALKRRSFVKHRVAYRLELWALATADAVVCQSQDMQADLAPRIGGRTRLGVIGNPIDIPRLKRLAAAVSDAALPGRPAVLAMGRLSGQKGFDVLIRAFADVHSQHPTAELTILGEGEARAELEALRDELGLTDVVHMPGKTGAPEPLLAAADLFVSSSRYEGFSNALLEAMALGRPVVATDCPGATRELVVPGETGRLVPSDDPAALSAAILAALETDDTAATSCGEAVCRNRYSAPVVVDAYATLLSQSVMETAA